MKSNKNINMKKMGKIKLDTISSTFFFEMPMTIYKFPHETTLHTFKKKNLPCFLELG